MSGAQFHEYANLFPMLQGEALAALKEDIREHGVREPVVFYDGTILDGRNRYTCAVELGIDFPREDFEGMDPLAFVISHNLHRRHLTESQRASIAARAANMGQGYRSDARPSANLQKVPLSQQAAAKMLNVSPRSVADANKVHSKAPEEIIQAVDDGRMSVSLAARVADLPDEAKADVISAPPEQMKEVARKAHVAHNSGNNEWYTPAHFIEAARAVMGRIDLDPASSDIANETVKAETYFTEEINGLEQPWDAAKIWMNPPYAQPAMGQFAKAWSEYFDCNGSPESEFLEGIALVNNATETAWFQDMARVCSAICFPKSRIKFLDPDGNAKGAPLQGQAIIYCGHNPKAFECEFSQFGLVVFHG